MNMSRESTNRVSIISLSSASVPGSGAPDKIRFFQQHLPSWAVVFLAIYFATFVLEGPLRWGLGKLGLSSLIYTRDILLCVLIGRALARFIAGCQMKVVGIFSVLICMALIVIAIGYSLSLPQVLFGVKVFLPLLCGAIYGTELVTRVQGLGIYAMGVVVVTGIGVLLDKGVNLPWSGLSINVGGAEIAVGKIWFAGEFRRLSGFARTSYDAAIFCLAFFILASGSAKGVVKALLWSAAAGTVLLTTTKGILLAFAVVTVGQLFRMVSRRIWALYSFGVGSIFILIGLSLPALSMFMTPSLTFDSKIERALLFSFFDRMVNTWPQAISQISGVSEWVIGRGIGAIGAAQAYFDPYHYNPADNVFVYALVSFGLVGITAVVTILMRVMAVGVGSPRKDVFRSMVIFICVYGVTTNLFDNPVLAFIIGALSSVGIYSARDEKKKPECFA